MKRQRMDLNKIGILPMSFDEMQQTEGGGGWDEFFKQAIGHLDEIAHGFAQGWNGQAYSK